MNWGAFFLSWQGRTTYKLSKLPFILSKIYHTWCKPIMLNVRFCDSLQAFSTNFLIKRYGNWCILVHEEIGIYKWKKIRNWMVIVIFKSWVQSSICTVRALVCVNPWNFIKDLRVFCDKLVNKIAQDNMAVEIISNVRLFI